MKIPERGIQNHEWRLEQLEDEVRRLSQRSYAGGPMGGGGGSTPTFYVGKASGNITAFSGSTPGVGTVEIWDGISGTAVATGTTRAVKNWGSIISTGKRVRIDLDGFGQWWASPEECES